MDPVIAGSDKNENSIGIKTLYVGMGGGVSASPLLTSADIRGVWHLESALRFDSPDRGSGHLHQHTKALKHENTALYLSKNENTALNLNKNAANLRQSSAKMQSGRKTEQSVVGIAITCNEHHSIPCNTVQYLAIMCNTVLYRAIMCNTVQYNTFEHHGIPCYFK